MILLLLLQQMKKQTQRSFKRFNKGCSLKPLCNTILQYIKNQGDSSTDHKESPE